MKLLFPYTMFSLPISWLLLFGYCSAQVNFFFNYPICAQGCLNQLAPRFCPTANNACLCPNQAFVNSWTACAKTSGGCNGVGQENSWTVFVYNCGLTGFPVGSLRPVDFGAESGGGTTFISVVTQPTPSPSPTSNDTPTSTSPEPSDTTSDTPPTSSDSPTPTETSDDSSTPTPTLSVTPLPEESLGPASSLSGILNTLPTGLPDSCGSADWDPTPANWASEGVDASLTSWWSSKGRTQGDFVTALFKSFGGKTGGVQCGVGYVDTCPMPSCEAFRTSGDPKWAYFAQVAVVRMNTLFNIIFTGITYGQVDFNSLLPHVASIFIPYHDPRSKLQKALPYIATVFEALLGIIPFAGPAASGGVRQAVSKAGEKLAEAGAAQLKGAANKNSPDPTSQHDGNIEALGVAVKETSDLARNTLEDWFSTLLAGKDDTTQRNIFDYLQSGAYTLPLTFTLQQITTFYTNVEISKVWNDQVRNNTKTFSMCATASGPQGDDPSEYYDATSKKRCRLYRLDDKSGTFTSLFGTDGLSEFNITSSDITTSSWRTYRDTKEKFASLDGDQTAFDQSLTAAYASNQADEQQPLMQGVRFGGVFSIPVCDVGTHDEWLSGDNYPCCCGDGCREQADFMDAVRMGGWDKVVDKCKKQYDGWKDVHYGSGAGELFVERMLMWTGVAVAVVGGWIL